MEYQLKRFAQTAPRITAGKALIEGCRKMLLDGIVSGEAAQKLAKLLADIDAETEEKAAKLKANQKSLPSDIPFSATKVALGFERKSFCLSGVFSRPRAEIEMIIKERGGKITDALKISTNYLVVGSTKEPAWSHENYGRKVEKVLTEWPHIPIVKEEDLLLAAGISAHPSNPEQDF